MLTCFFDSRGIVHHEYAPKGQTINKEYYLEVLRRLPDAVQRKRPDMCTGKNWQLHHDNAPAYFVRNNRFFGQKQYGTLRQPPYYSDLAPCDFWLFPKLKTTLKGASLLVTYGHYGKNDGGAQEHSRGGVQEVFLKVAEALGKVCALARGVF